MKVETGIIISITASLIGQAVIPSYNVGRVFKN
jgi:hypothetical protein